MKWIISADILTKLKVSSFYQQKVALQKKIYLSENFVGAHARNKIK